MFLHVPRREARQERLQARFVARGKAKGFRQVTVQVGQAAGSLAKQLAPHYQLLPEMRERVQQHGHHCCSQSSGLLRKMFMYDVYIYVCYICTHTHIYMLTCASPVKILAPWEERALAADQACAEELPFSAGKPRL